MALLCGLGTHATGPVTVYHIPSNIPYPESSEGQQIPHKVDSCWMVSAAFRIDSAAMFFKLRSKQQTPQC